MTKCFAFAWLLLGAVTAAAATNDLVQNGSFESGYANWLDLGAATRSLVSPGHGGTNAVRLANRASLQSGTSQDLLGALLANGSGTRYTTRGWVKADAPVSVRMVAQLQATAGSPRVLLAERMIRESETNQWVFIEGTETVSWSGTLNVARLAFDLGQMVEAVYPSYTLDEVSMQPDADGDKLTDAEEFARGTNPSLADHDGDGLPDGWEAAHGCNPLDPTDGAFDSDGDGFTNSQEYWAATDPQSGISFPGKPSATNAAPDARKVLLRLALGPSLATNRCFAGQWLSGAYPNAPGEYTNFVVNLAAQTGHWPGVLAVTYEKYAETFQIAAMNPLASNYWNAGGLVLVRFAPANPWTRGFFGDTNGLRDFTQLVTPGSAAYTNWLGYLDTCAAGLAELRNAGVVVLFDFLHEQNGAWFWWGRRPRADYVALYRNVQDYFTQTKGLTNLLWIFHPSEGPHLTVPMDYYYPGDAFVDVVGPSVYHNTWNWSWNWDDIWRAYPKVFALPEADAANNTTPWDLRIIGINLHTTLGRCSFFNAWSTFKNGPLPTLFALIDNDHAQELLDDPFVGTREDLDWRTFFTPTLSLAQTNSLSCVNWSGGCLDQSGDLVNWTAVTNAAPPCALTTNVPAGFYRVRRKLL